MYSEREGTMLSTVKTEAPLPELQIQPCLPSGHCLTSDPRLEFMLKTAQSWLPRPFCIAVPGYPKLLEIG